jgi:hypothetical protein
VIRTEQLIFRQPATKLLSRPGHSLPPSNPDHIVVQQGGGIESTQIKAEIYDGDSNLGGDEIEVTFRLNPVLPGCYLEEVGQTEVTITTQAGIASVSVNSGTEPGVIRIEVEVDCDQDGTVDLSAASDQVIISSGAQSTSFQSRSHRSSAGRWH